MKNVDEKAMELIQEWRARRPYRNEALADAALQSAIVTALKRQDRDTRHACCQAINNQFAERWSQSQSAPVEAELTLAVMNVKAV